MAHPGTPYRPIVENGHAITLLAWGRRRRFPRLPLPEARHFDVAPDARVLAHCHWQPVRADHPTLLLLHGLEGSSLAHYMGGMADKAWAEGWNVVRLNQRNCGGTEHLSRGLYHSGLTADPLAVMRELVATDALDRFVVAGYSLGGNIALKLAGEVGDRGFAPLIGVCAVSPTMDLPACVEALERRSNAVYAWNFVRNLKARMRRKAAAFPDLYDLGPLGRVRTVREFDEAYTAPHHGFRDAADYYHRASALRVAHDIRVPALVLASENDPFVPPDAFRHLQASGPSPVSVVLTRHGGHCAYVERADSGYDGYWAEREVVRFAVRAAAGAPGQTPVPSLPVRA